MNEQNFVERVNTSDIVEQTDQGHEQFGGNFGFFR